MSIKCGKCKQRHALPDEVRACYQGIDVPVVKEPANILKGGVVWPPSDAQVKYVLGLQEQRSLPPEFDVHLEPEIRAMDKAEVSRLIEELKRFPYKAPISNGQQQQWTMPEGRYAIKPEAGPGVGTGRWSFFEITKPTEGRWAGYTFIKRLIGAPGAYRKENMSKEERTKWLTAIEKDPKQAMVDYGLESGVCGRCASPLTDPDSLARGLGPVCAGKSGWF